MRNENCLFFDWNRPLREKKELVGSLADCARSASILKSYPGGIETIYYVLSPADALCISHLQLVLFLFQALPKQPPPDKNARDSTQKKLSPQSSICEATAKRFRAAVYAGSLWEAKRAHTHAPIWASQTFEVNEYLRAMATRSDASLFCKD